jgi:molybdopterin/thiamine biosynthesis adenylyltransferase
MNPIRFYKRVAAILDPERIRRRRVAVVGVGSGGARVALELGRLGISLLLVDRPGERLEEHNIVRHVLGYRSLGELKLPELQRTILDHNPLAQVRCKELDVVEGGDEMEELFTEWRPDLIAVCTDNEASKHALNRVALALGIDQVGAGVYDGGIGGEVYRIRTGDACYGCIADKLQLRRYASAESSAPDYSSPESRTPSTCALNLDIEQIASLQSRMILDGLLGEAAGFTGLAHEINLCVFANRTVPGTFSRPWTAQFFRIARRGDCLECGTEPEDTAGKADRILAALGS